MKRITIAFSGLFFLIAFLFLFSAPFGFTLSNVDRESWSQVFRSQKDELYLRFPKELHSTEFQNIEIQLKDKEGKEIEFTALFNYPPYPEVDETETYEAVIISIAPNAFSRGDYTLSILKDERIIDQHDIKLRYEFVAPWDY
jgi:hypothetical protein